MVLFGPKPILLPQDFGTELGSQGGAAGIYDIWRLQFKRCAELDEAARLRLTVAGVIREHPRFFPGPSVNFGYLIGTRQAYYSRFFRISRHPRKTKSAFPLVFALFAALMEDAKHSGALIALVESLGIGRE